MTSNQTFSFLEAQLPRSEWNEYKHNSYISSLSTPILPHLFVLGNLFVCFNRNDDDEERMLDNNGDLITISGRTRVIIRKKQSSDIMSIRAHVAGLIGRTDLGCEYKGKI